MGKLNSGYDYRDELGGRGTHDTALSWLSRRHPHSTSEQWVQRIEAGEVLIDGQIAQASSPLDTARELIWKRPPWEEPEVPDNIHDVFQDDHLLIVSKPSGLPTMPAGGFLDNTLLMKIRQRFPNATPMHRLGRGTSGLVMFALTSIARSTLQQAWREHQVEKLYQTVIAGLPDWEIFHIDIPIGSILHPKLGTVFAAVTPGKSSQSQVRVIERRVDTTLVTVQIYTGRPHQIRIHLATIGFPLVGDPLYRIGGVVDANSLPGDIGYWLHAYQLSFIHPIDGCRRTVVDDLTSQSQFK